MSCTKSSDKPAPSQNPLKFENTGTRNGGEATLSPAEQKKQQELRQCALDLCGPESQYLAMIAQGPFGSVIPRDVQEYLQNEIDPILNQAYDLSTTELKLRLTLVSNFVKTKPQAKLSEHQFAAMLVPYFLAKFQKDFDQNVLTSQATGTRLAIDAEQLIKKTKKNSLPSFIRKAVPVVNAYLGSEGGGTGNNVRSLTFDMFRHLILSQPAFRDSSLSEVYKKIFVQQLESGVQDTIKEFGSPVFEDSDVSVISKLWSDSLTRGEKNMFMEIFSRMNVYSGLASEEVKTAVTQSGLGLADVLRDQNWSQLQSDLTRTLSSADESKAEKDKWIKTCHENMVQAIAAAPSAFRQRKTLELSERVKAAAKVAAASYLTGEALEKGRAAIDGIKFEKPISGDEVRVQLASAVQTKISILEKRRIPEGADVAEDQQEALISRLLGRQLPNADDSKTVSRELLGLCENLKPSPFEDKALSSIGVIQMGWQTTSFPEIGAGVMAHEMGHVVSGAVKDLTANNQGYTETRMCSQAQHEKLMPRMAGKIAFSQFQEEDWADSFSISTMKELSKEWPHSNNFACALISLDDKAETFSDLRLFDQNGVDTHSTGFFRAIMVGLSLNKELPASCRSTLGETQSEIMTRTCAK